MLKLTNKKPNSTGFYWIKKVGHVPEIVGVDRCFKGNHKNSEKLYFYYLGDSKVNKGTEWVDEVEATWAEIPTPVEEKQIKFFKSKSKYGIIEEDMGDIYWVEYHNGMKITSGSVKKSDAKIISEEEFDKLVRKHGDTSWYSHLETLER